jgi:beta-glucosidase
MTTPPHRIFPPDFIWGVATASTQIEGAWDADGKGESVWDRFAATPGKVANGDTPAVACDHYHLFDQDFALMKSLGIKNYRLSIAWPRICPQGDRMVNRKGLDFYRRIFDALDRHGITPWVTMFHWDLPQELETRFGGWRDRRVVDAFAFYADVLVREFAGRVKHWITLNEILCFTHMGYGNGQKAPGLRLPRQIVSQSYHHALLCHGQGVRAVREHGGSGARVGLVDNSIISVPFTDTAADVAAAREEFCRDNRQILDPIYRRGYSADFLRECGPDAPVVEPGDFDSISLPTDFLGLNLYTGKVVRAGDDGRPEELPFPESYPAADTAWLKILPQVMYWGPKWVAEIYHVPAIYITENGCGYREQPGADGQIYDLHRTELLRTYLAELHRGLHDGHPVQGYFLWSFLDNFEWEDGYDMRFGIVHCDYASQRRTPKASARWYACLLAGNRLP